MKCLKITENLDKCKCPYCNTDLEHLDLNGTASASDTNHHYMLPINGMKLSSKNEDSQFFKEGGIYMCSECKELLFLYTETDCRKCSNCKHYGPIKCKTTTMQGDKKEIVMKGCTWDNIPFGIRRFNYEYTNTDDYLTDANTRCCKHIDEDKPVLPEYASCKLCVYYRPKVHQNYYSDGSSYTEMRCEAFSNITCRANKLDWIVEPCSNFKASLEKYKEYRSQFDGLLIIPEDAIVIPEFDKLIEQEASENA